MDNPPLFQTPGVDDRTRRRLLVISYHFPPDRAVGARRWEKLAHFVAERGWGMDVITCHDPYAAALDTTRLATLPDGVRVFCTPMRAIVAQRLEKTAWRLLKGSQRESPARRDGGVTPPTSVSPAAAPERPESLAREEVRWDLGTPRGYLRLYWSWFDFAYMGAWVRDAVRLAAAIGNDGGHIAVVSSGPPHLTHEAGRRASKRLGIPFVMDMRDPWWQSERLGEGVATPFWLALAGYHERRAVRQASLIVANTEIACRNLKKSYPARVDDIMTVMNGADDDPLPPSRRGGRFVIAHAGTVYLDRDPRGLFQASARIIRELALSPTDFGLEFIGDMSAVGGFPILQVAEQEGIAAYVSVGPPRSSAQAMEFMANATMLLTMSGGNMAAIPAKTFECIRFEAWVLALAASGSATELVLRDSGADVIAPSDVDGIVTAIRNRYLQHRAGVIPPRISDDDRFSRRTQATRLLDAMQGRIDRV